jgi:hypothetical protein
MDSFTFFFLFPVGVDLQKMVVLRCAHTPLLLERGEWALRIQKGNKSGGKSRWKNGDSDSLLHAACRQEGGDSTARCDVTRLIRGHNTATTFIIR